MKKFTYGIPKLCFERAILSVGMSWLGCGHLDELDRAMGKPCFSRGCWCFPFSADWWWDESCLASILQLRLFAASNWTFWSTTRIYIYVYTCILWCFCVSFLNICKCRYVLFRKTFERQHGLAESTRQKSNAKHPNRSIIPQTVYCGVYS